MNMDSLTRLVRAIFQNATEPLGFISVNVKFLTPLYEYIEESIGRSLARPDGPPVTLLEHLPPVYVDINREGQVLFSLERDKLRCPHILTFHFGRTEARARVYQGEDMCRAELRFSDTDQGLFVDFVTDIPETSNPSDTFQKMAYSVNQIVERYRP
jgi:hypothetical protein